MRHIAKICDRSTVYKAWLEDLEANGKSHPAYNSSQGGHYWDIVMNLFHCQNGLCAYTETLLCAPEHYTAESWAEGCYAKDRPEVMGQLEHFDRGLKQTKGWLWSNLFMVNSDVNTKVKKTKPIDIILKPDADDYDPFLKLEYDLAKGVFIAHSSLEGDLKGRVTKMILTLGINHSTIRELRRVYLSPILQRIEFGISTWEGTSVAQFPTAFEMVRRQRQAEQSVGD